MGRLQDRSSKAIFDWQAGGSSQALDWEQAKTLRLYGYFWLLLWPLLAPISVIMMAWIIFRALISKPATNSDTIIKVCKFILLLPIHLISSSLRMCNWRLVLGVVLLLPFLVTALVGLFTNFDTESVSSVILHAPNISHPFGTDGEGVGIAELIIEGARRTYFISLEVAIIVVSLGVWLGKLTYSPRAGAGIMATVEVVESVPLLFVLLVALTLVGWWEDVWRAGAAGRVLAEPARIFIIGAILGLGLMPRMVRLLQERIRTFTAENFVLSAKAHGIPLKKILWFHVIWKNCLGDILVLATHIWALAILLEISLNYLITIMPLLGARVYGGWAGMLLTYEARDAIVHGLCEGNGLNWWLYVFPGLFILATVVGCYLFGDGLRSMSLEKRVVERVQVTRLDWVMRHMPRTPARIDRLDRFEVRSDS